MQTIFKIEFSLKPTVESIITMKFLIILLILALIQNIQSEITSEKVTPSTFTEVTGKNKIASNKKEDIQQPAAVVAPVKAKSPSAPSPLPVEIKVYNDSALRKDISELNRRQSQQELYLKDLIEDAAYIKKYVIKIFNQDSDWTVILRRKDGSEDFYRTWNEYKEGFGDPQGEFFIGLETLHEMTTEGDPQEVLFIMEDWDYETRYAKYNKFVVGGEDEKYAIAELGDYSGDAGDSFSYHRTRKFSTKDQDNDNNPTANCAVDYKGAWWFDNCYSSHLNGPYSKGARSCRGGINWYHWHNYLYSLKTVEMMIKTAPEAEE